MAIDPVVLSSLTGAFEEAINKTLQYSPASQKHVDLLDGTVIDICTEPVTFRLQFGNHRIFIHHQADESPAHASIIGSPLSLLRLATSTNALTNLGDNGVVIEGDSEAIQQFYTFARTLDIDYEAMLAEITGGIPAHFIGNTIRSLLRWTRSANKSMESNIEEYLQEEGRQVPARVETEIFADEVDELRFSVDRLEARIEHLGQQNAASITKPDTIE
jgi:ubiquinone biosynthesis protein UbiJ